MTPTIYIDGEAGTTGLEIRKRLEGRTDIQIVSIDPAKRKDVAERARLLNECDISILCLPDDAAREAASLTTNPGARLIDASTAHRVAPDWVYGFPELTRDQAERIRHAKRVSNPGCYPTGTLALLHPLVDKGIIAADQHIVINAISGYSGGGKDLIALCSSGDTSNPRNAGFCLYGLEQKHKHVPEMRVHAGLRVDPTFLPSYSNAFYRGMLVQIVLNDIDGEAIHATLIDHYRGQKYVWVEALQTKLESGYVLTPLEQNDTNNVQLRVFWNAEKKTAILTACLDNLGKGASGAAVQNMNLMLGLADR